MERHYTRPESTRGRIVYFFWFNMPRFILLGMIALIIVLAVFIVDKFSAIKAAQEAAIKQERPPVNTVVMKVAPATISNTINLPGSIEPWTSLELVSKISGSIEEVMVREGDAVKEGDVIARIEADDYRIAFERAQAAYKLAKADFERDQKVFAEGVIPPAELDMRKTNMQTAKSDLENARLMYDRCTIKAPMNGVVRRLDAKVGLYLGIGDPIGRILQIDRVKAVIGIPESDITAVRTLDEIAITIQALDDRKINGRRHFVSTSPETAARLYRLELEVDNPGHEILPGMFVRATIVKQSRDHALSIPFYSIISRNDEQFIYVEQEGSVKKRNVKTGIMEKWMVEITDGLSEGERVVVEGHRDVEDGQKVKVVKEITDPGAYSL